MQVTINIQKLIDDIRRKSHLEFANVQDPTVRYKKEVGSEKIGEIKRDLEEAASTIVNECYRFLSAPVNYDVDNTVPAITDYVFVIVGSSRRFDGKEKAVAQKIHEAMVDLALQKYYISVSEADLANAHQKQATAGILELKRMLTQKRPPKIIEL